jgi:hypothetical protein
MVESYAAKGGTFSGKGFYVSIEDTDVTLPECFEAQGREVKSGLDFLDDDDRDWLLRKTAERVFF